MRFIRAIAFVLALLVLLAHDVVPHDHDDDLTDHSHDGLVLVDHESHLLHELEHALAHFRHHDYQKSEVKFDLPTTHRNNQNFLPDLSPGVIPGCAPEDWYVNLKKHRFRYFERSANCSPASSSALRGPPNC